MPKKDELVNVLLGQSIIYEGIFSLRELYKMIDAFFKVKGYERAVLLDQESSTESGRNILTKLRPYNAAKSDSIYEIQLTLNISNMTDTIKEVDGMKVKFDKGKVQITIDAFILYNVRGKWESRAEYYFIRTIFDKYLFKPESGKHEGRVKAHAIELRNELSSHLNLYKFLY
jgi:hypothetical protein